MSTENNNQQIGILIKELLEQRSWSMGRLSSRTGIDKATISRIVNGKRRANLQHLQKFSQAFGVPLETFMKSDGYDIQTADTQREKELHTALENVQSFLEISDMSHMKISMENIEEELRKYSRVAETNEGQTLILDGFEKKLQNIGSGGPYIGQLKELYLKYRLKKASPAELALIGSALIYFIMPMDLIPDYLFPIGYLDDALAIQLVMNMLSMKD